MKSKFNFFWVIWIIYKTKQFLIFHQNNAEYQTFWLAFNLGFSFYWMLTLSWFFFCIFQIITVPAVLIMTVIHKKTFLNGVFWILLPSVYFSLGKLFWCSRQHLKSQPLEESLILSVFDCLILELCLPRGLVFECRVIEDGFVDSISSSRISTKCFVSTGMPWSTTIKQISWGSESLEFSDFPVHIEVMFILYCSLLTAIALCLKNNVIP